VATLITAERPDTADAMGLIEELDTHLSALYARESRHGFSVEKLLQEQVAFFVTRVGGAPAGCGVKLFGREFAEIKRMYVRPEFRGRGLGRLMLEHLAAPATSHGITVLRLETGIHQHAAIALDEDAAFRRIPPFPPYRDDPVSRCYEKVVDGSRGAA
jgi:GNAT superfamily N-acetyltransferase